jgi:arylsulfatase A-like enzyme
MVRDGELINEPGYVTDKITDDALVFLDAHADDGEPFYLSVHYTAPHSPWDCHPQAIVNSYDDCAFDSCPQEPRHPWATSLTDRCLGNREMLKGYFAAVTAMDANVGRLLDRLEERGLREDTLVIFVSDNGFSCGHHGFWGKGNGTEPRNMYENSIRVPFIVSHPGRVPVGQVQEAMVSAYDVMPTLLDYLDLPICQERDPVGHSFLPVLLGQGDEAREQVVIYDEYGNTRMVRTSEAKYVRRYPHGPDELWDLVEDPYERYNLIDDPGQEARIAEMEQMLEDWFARYVDPQVDGVKQDVTGRGQLRPVFPTWHKKGPAYHQD